MLSIQFPTDLSLDSVREGVSSAVSLARSAVTSLLPEVSVDVPNQDQKKFKEGQ